MPDEDRSRPEAARRWRGRLAYFALGLAGFVLCSLVETIAAKHDHWFAKPLLRNAFLSNSLWVALGAVLAARLYWGRRVRAISFLLGLLLPVVLLAGWLLYGPTIADHWHRTEFDAVAWRAESPPEELHWPPRLRMVDDLMESGQLDGLMKEEVVALLGPAEGFPGREGWDLLYYLGPERGLFRIDSEHLVITIGDGGRVERYWIYRD